MTQETGGLRPSDQPTASVSAQLKELPRDFEYSGKLIVFTPFYQSFSTAQYTSSMVATAIVLERLKVKWDYWPYPGDFHVERACNLALAKFLADEEATDFLLIDSDESWDIFPVLRLMLHPHEVVGCAYRMKNNWERYTCQLMLVNGQPQGYVGKDGKAILRAERIPAGFMRLKKSAVRKLADSCGEDWYWDGGLKVPRFFKTGVIDHTFFSQDFLLSERMKEIGIELWIDPNANIGHAGLTEYAGNLDKALRKQGADAKTQKAFAEVKKMADEIEQRAA